MPPRIPFQVELPLPKEGEPSESEFPNPPQPSLEKGGRRSGEISAPAAGEGSQNPSEQPPEAPQKKRSDKPLTVSQLTRQIRMALEGEFRSVWVEGELSNMSRAASGHVYFTLHDEESQVSGVMFRRAASALRFQPVDGLEVVIRGHLGVYAPRGVYQVNASAMEPRGMGALQLAFEQLRDKLAKEGLFEKSRKRPLPFLPKHIGIVTSPTGAVIHDMLSVLCRRFQGIPVTLFPTIVQGNQAVPALVEGMRVLNTLSRTPPLDVIIVGRGGGSMEDLWAFNDERLARALADSRIPVISAVGHETDFTIADFVADLRAPTPSAAMELAVPERLELEASVQEWRIRLQRGMQQQLRSCRDHLTQAGRQLGNPESGILQFQQRVDDLDMRLRERWQARVDRTRFALEEPATRLRLLQPSRQLPELRSRVKTLQQQLPKLVKQRLQAQQAQVEQHIGRLDSLSPLRTLERGYSMATTTEGKIVKSRTQVHPGDELALRLADGTVHTTVQRVESQT